MGRSLQTARHSQCSPRLVESHRRDSTSRTITHPPFVFVFGLILSAYLYAGANTDNNNNTAMWFIHSKKWLNIPQLCTTTWSGLQITVFVNLISLLVNAYLAANKPVKFRVQSLYTLQHTFSRGIMWKPASGCVKRWVFNQSVTNEDWIQLSRQ